MPVDAQRVDEIYCEAEAMPPEAREEFLDRACGGDPDLRREVRSLLDAAGSVEHDFLEEPLLLGEGSGAAWEGRRLGAYRLLEEIGRGGMSRVFLAVRDDPEVDQKVAVKVLLWGRGTREAVRRFERERRILASLEHPYVARFLDCGATDEALPYVVMERVEGEPVDRFCERRRLSVRQRLELFRKVCSAVQFAHHHLIVHRDLKPGNVLVTAGGTPKLLDFGIAKLLPEDPASGAPAPAHSLLTATGLQPMTLAYASPEQIRGGDIGTASDVYSLGVLLYQLLTGSRPYGRPDDSALELARAACEDEAARPSAVAARNGRPEARRRLAGDLDSIVLKALEKDPRRRYGSAEQLADDVRRHLEGLPVQAREATVGYRLGKYLRRHRLELTWVAAVFAVVAAFAVHALVSREEAVRERQQAEFVTRFMVSLFESPDPEKLDRSEVTARELLDRNVDRVLEDDSLAPRVRADLLQAMSSAYLGLGLFDRAGPLVDRSVELREESAAVEDLASALLQQAEVLRARDRLEEAAATARQALEVLRAGASDPILLSKALNNLALLEKDRGDLRSAESSYREALQTKLEVFREELDDVARGRNNLAATLRAQGKYREAEEHYRRVLALRVELHGEGSWEVASSRNNLAVLLRDRGDLEAAEPLFREALAARRKIYGEEHPTVATSLNNLGLLLHLRDRVDEAAALYRRALEIRRRAFGADHSLVARVLRNQALLFLAQGDVPRAEATARRAFEIFQETHRQGHWRIADALGVLGECLLADGRSAQAAPLLDESHRALEAALGADARQTREARERLERLEPVSAE